MTTASTCIECGCDDPKHDASCDTGARIERDSLRAHVAELEAHLAAEKKDAGLYASAEMLKAMVTALMTTSADNPAKNYVACHIEWDEGAWAGLNLPFQRVQLALIRPGMQSPTEKLGMAEARSLAAEARNSHLSGAITQHLAAGAAMRETLRAARDYLAAFPRPVPAGVTEEAFLAWLDDEDKEWKALIARIEAHLPVTP